MAVTHGMSTSFYLNGYDAGAWATQARYAMVKTMDDVTVFSGNSGVKSYGATMRDATASFSGFFDLNTTTDANSGDYALNTAMDTAIATANQVNLLYFPYGATTAGDRGYGFTGDIQNYQVSQSVDGVSTVQADFQSSIGKDNVLLLAALAARTNSFTGTAVDNSASSANGGTGYLHVTTHTSGTLPMLIEHSTDNISYSTLITFTSVTTSHQAQRSTVTGTVNRYTRAKAVGTYNSTCLVAFDRN